MEGPPAPECEISVVLRLIRITVNKGHLGGILFGGNSIGQNQVSLREVSFIQRLLWGGLTLGKTLHVRIYPPGRRDGKQLMKAPIRE